MATNAAEMRAKAERGIQGTEEAQNQLRLVMDKFDEVARLYMTLSDHSSVAGAIAVLNQAKEKVLESITEASRANDQINTYAIHL
jgi:hypothetical protein